MTIADILAWPLVIDLDGTLLKTNSLDETLLDALRRSPFELWKLPFKTHRWPRGVQGVPGPQFQPGCRDLANPGRLSRSS